MQTPLELVFRHMEAAPHVESKARERTERLERYFGRIESCVVTVEAPHQHQRKGNQYEVKIRLRVPSGEITVDHEPGDVNAHADVLVAIRDAFDAAERQLRKWKQTHSGRPAEHAAPEQGRVRELRAEEGWGWIAVTDGRMVYFHRNSVVGEGFDGLSVDDPVELVIDYEGAEDGPHASTVRPISAQRFVDKPD